MNSAEIFKSLVWDNAVKRVLTDFVFANSKFLSFGPIKFLITKIVIHFADLLFKAIIMAIDMQKIAWKNESLEKEFKTAELKLKLIARDHGIESEEFKVARKENQDALYKLVSFAPSN